MKVKPTILLFLVLSISLIADSSMLVVPGASSVNLSADSVSAQGVVSSSVGATQTQPSNITITGGLRISGNNVVSFIGLGPSLPVRVYISGSIDLVDNGTLVLKYATLYFLGATKPYDRFIRLSNSTVDGHPRLIMTNSTIIGRKVSNVLTYGVALYAYNNSEISAYQFSLYREAVNTRDYNSGGQTAIKCYGQSSVNLTSSKFDTMFVYDTARVSIYTGSGPRKIALAPDAGIGFEIRNSSFANLVGVSIKNITVSDDAHLTLTSSTELLHGIVKASNRARIECLEGTALQNSVSAPKPPSTTPVLIPAINASGDSYVSLSSSSKISSAFNYYPIVTLYDRAVFAVVKDGILSGGIIISHGYSKVFLNNTISAGGLTNMGVEGHDFSSILFSNVTIFSQPFAVQMSLYGNSSLSMIDSTISGGWIRFLENSSVYISRSFLRSSSVVGGYGLRVSCQDNARVAVTDSQITSLSFEVGGNAEFALDSSLASVVFCVNSSRVALTNSNITLLSVGDTAKVRVANSTLGELLLSQANVIGSFVGLTSYFENSSLALGSGLRLDIFRTGIAELNLFFSGDSNVTFVDSAIRSITLRDSSVAILNNTSLSGTAYLTGTSKVFAYSSLRVRCVDYFGNPINGSTVTIVVGYGGRIVGQQVTGTDGLASFNVFSEMDNSTGSFPLGVITVKGSSGGTRISEVVTVGLVNEDMTVSFPLPFWTLYILPSVVSIVTILLLVLIYYIVKRVRGTKV